MADSITFEELENFAIDAVKQLLAVAPAAEELAANNAKAIINDRVFNQGSKDVGGKPLGYTGKGVKQGAYTKAYARRKQVLYKASQTSKVDLQASGQLKASLQVGTSGGRPVLGIVPGNRNKGKNLNGTPAKGKAIDNADLRGFIDKRYGDTIAISGKEAGVIEKSIIKYLEKNIKI